MVGDEGGRIWQLAEDSEFFEEIVQFPDGISEITAQARNCVLIGDMRGQVTRLDLSNFTEETIQQITAIDHLAPVKCIQFFSEQLIATASQDGSVQIADLRANEKIASLAGIHAIDAHKNARSTCTGLVLNPSRPNLFYTCGTPDPEIRTWDLRKLPKKRSFRPVEQFTPALQSKRHRSSVSLTIDSLGSRLFLSTSNNRYNSKEESSIYFLVFLNFYHFYQSMARWQNTQHPHSLPVPFIPICRLIPRIDIYFPAQLTEMLTFGIRADKNVTNFQCQLNLKSVKVNGSVQANKSRLLASAMT